MLLFGRVYVCHLRLSTFPKNKKRRTASRMPKRLKLKVMITAHNVYYVKLWRNRIAVYKNLYQLTPDHLIFTE